MAKKAAIKKVLILEDEEALAKMYADRLKEAGYEVRIFNKTDGLFEGCIDFKPDIAFIDHTLVGSETTGTDSIPLVRKCNPDMKVIMLTNYSTFQMKAGATKAGADDYLLKINTPPDVLVNYLKQH